MLGRSMGRYFVSFYLGTLWSFYITVGLLPHRYNLLGHT